MAALLSSGQSKKGRKGAKFAQKARGQQPPERPTGQTSKFLVPRPLGPLHAQDKPFECHECGKKFSRNDNLSQHARTHGSGAVVMNLIDGSEEALDMMPSGDPEIANFGTDGDSNGKKKRKRSD
ncbi:hypothetical protein GGR56DRAFT_678235 [Xylariaceae sp. FL0804]|nr:hypothetical protein GGR56DRAFT_678235 [Xylariaceae sp. FL0804]